MEQDVSFYVYIVASRRNGTLYIGMTDDLVRRVWMHREGILPGFTKRYGVMTLVWYEQHESRVGFRTRTRNEEVELFLENRTDSDNESRMA